MLTNREMVNFQKYDFFPRFFFILLLLYTLCHYRGTKNTYWFKLYFICIIYDKYTNNTVYDYNTITIQMGFRRKSNDLFESVSQEFTLLVYVLSTIVRTFKCVPLFFSRNVLFLIYNLAQLERVLHFQHPSDQYYHIRKH